jgi:hypothetical protein
MVIGTSLAVLLIFLLPAMGLGGGWMLAVAFGALTLCHLMHFGMHKDDENGDSDHEHRH